MGLTYIVGDIHGQYAKLVQLLQRAGLVGDSLAWTGGEAQLWCGERIIHGHTPISYMTIRRPVW